MGIETNPAFRNPPAPIIAAEALVQTVEQHLRLERSEAMTVPKLLETTNQLLALLNQGTTRLNHEHSISSPELQNRISKTLGKLTRGRQRLEIFQDKLRMINRTNWRRF